jgi:hypothetical protein
MSELIDVVLERARAAGALIESQPAAIQRQG